MDTASGDKNPSGDRARDDSSAYLRSVVDTVREPLVVLDSDLRVKSANRSFYRTFQVAPQDTEGQLLYSLGNGQWDIPRLRTLLDEILPRNASFDDFDVEHNFPDIGRKIMLLNARKLRQEGAELILLAIEDVTEQRRIEAERQEIETRFTSLVKNVKDHSIFTLDPAGRVTSWNVAAEHMLGYTQAEVLGQHFEFIFSEEDRQQGMPEAELRGARAEGRAEDERWHVRKGGERLWALGIVSALHDAEGKLIGFSKILRDMTEWKRAEEALAREVEAMRLLQSLSVHLIQPGQSEQLHEQILDTARSLARADMASLQVHTRERCREGEFQLIGHRGFDEEAARFWQWVTNESRTACGKALREGKRIEIEDIGTSELLAGTDDLRLSQALGIRSVQTTPLLSRSGELLGAFSTHWKQPHSFSEAERRMLDVLARQAADLLDRQRAEAALRESEERQAFLLRLSDALRSPVDPKQIQTTAARILGEHLGVTRAMYAEVDGDPGSERGTIRGTYLGPDAETLAPFPDRYDYSAYGEQAMGLRRRGEPMVVADVIADPAFSESERAAWAAAGVRAAIAVPLVQEGRFVADFGVQSATAREWTRTEVALVKETAERTWAAMLRAKAEAALQASEERLRLALAAARMGTWSWEVEADRHHRDANLNLLLGLEPSETVLPIADFFARVHPDEQAAVRDAFDATVRQGHNLSLEFRVFRPSGEVRWLRDQGDVFGEPDARQMAGACVDITERKLMEEALRESDRRKDEFLAVLGHELRNPLAPLSVVADLLQRTRDRPDLIDTVQPMLRRQLDHLTRLVDDLLDLSRISRGHAELQRAPLDLREALDAAIEQNRPLISQRQHELGAQLGETALRIDGDFQRLTQVFGNLLSNAAKYSDPGGEIAIRAAREGDMAVVRVTDNGFGIPKERVAHLFQMFSQVPEHRARVGGGGLGIGLALSRQLVELHGGSIEARSEGLERGSEFIVRLPLAAAAESEQQVGDDERRERITYRRVLVLDDNTDAADSLRMMLELQGHEAKAIYDARTALEAVEQFAPDVVLLDLGLPHMDGFEVARRIRATPGGRRIRLVALTGWGQREDRKRSTEAGFDAHLTKPVTSALLSAVLRIDDSIEATHRQKTE